MTKRQSKPKPRKAPSSESINVIGLWLRRWTDGDDYYWMGRIGRLIARDARPPAKGEKYGTMATNRNWLAEIAEEVYARVCAKDSGDHNIASARALAMVMALWGCRIARAKCCDPRRKKADRIKFFANMLEYYHVLMDCLVDESRDHKYFTNPIWTLPHAPEPVKIPNKRSC